MSRAYTDEYWLSRYEAVPECGCWIWLGGVQSCGYGYVRDGYLAHRFFYEKLTGTKIGNLCALHRCDNRLCVNPSHIFLGTRKDNLDDMWAKGRARPQKSLGSNHGMAKLDDATVLRIRKDKRTGTAIAAELGLAHTTIYAIRNKKIWKHLT